MKKSMTDVAGKLMFAYAMGADPNIENANGQTVFHFLNRAFEPEMREATANAAANILRQSTQVATPIAANTCLRRRL